MAKLIIKANYGPIAKGGNGLILHSALAIEPENGQPMGLLWQKLWNRESKLKPPLDETQTQKKQRQAAARQEPRNRQFEQKESYNKWVEAMKAVENLVSQHTRVIHVFDREGDSCSVRQNLPSSDAMISNVVLYQLVIVAVLVAELAHQK